MEWIETIIGKENHVIAWWQVGIRGFLMFFVAWVLVRIAGIRTFGKRSAIDIITLFMLGAMLARPIPGTVPFLPTVFAALIVVCLHRLLAVLAYHWKGFGKIIKGKNVVIYENGDFCKDIMSRHSITEEEVIESVRKCLHTEDLSHVEKVYFEPSGRINVLTKTIARESSGREV